MWNGTNGFTRLSTLYYNFLGWFQSSTGIIFCTSTSIYNTFIIDDINGTVTEFQMGSAGLWSNWHETAWGDIFVSSSSGNYGLFKYNGSGFTSVYPSGSASPIWFETDTDLFVSLQSAVVAGALHWNKTTQNFDQVISTGFSWDAWHQDSNGNIFTSSTNSTVVGLLHYNGTGFDTAITVGYNWIFCTEDNNGASFVSAAAGSAMGIYHWNGNGFDQVYSSGIGYRNWIKTSSGDILTSAASGILRWNNITFVSAFSLGTAWMFSENNGNITATSNYLTGRIIYDPVSQTFAMDNPVLTGKPFGTDYAMFSDANTLGRICKGELASVLTSTYTLAVTSNGKYAATTSTDSKKLLYV